MKIIKQPKAQMHATVDSVEADASQAASRQTGGAPVSVLPLSPGNNYEVVATAKHRLIANADKRRIVLAAAACTKAR